MAAKKKSWLGAWWRPLAALLLWVLGMVPLIAAPPLLPSLAETRVGGLTSYPADFVQASSLLTIESHRACAPPLYDLASGCSVAAKSVAPAKRATGETVLGHYPDYVKMSEQLGARRFEIPTDVWNKMSPAEQWAANQKFLDRTIGRGDSVLLATPPGSVRPGSFLERELQYMTGKGYTVSPDGTRLLPPGGN